MMLKNNEITFFQSLMCGLFNKHLTYDDYKIDFIDTNTRLTVLTYCSVCGGDPIIKRIYRLNEHGSVDLINVYRYKR